MEPSDRSQPSEPLNRSVPSREALPPRSNLVPRRPVFDIRPRPMVVSPPQPVTPIAPQPVLPLNPVFQQPVAAPIAPILPTPVVPPVTKRRRRPIVRLVAGGILAAGIIGAGVLLVVNHLNHQPSQILLQAITNGLSGQLKNQSFTGSFNGPEFQSTFDGGMNSSGQFRLILNATVAGSNLKTELRSPDGKSLYFNTVGLPQLLDSPQLTAADQSVIPGLIKLYGPVLRQLNNQWYQTTVPIKSLSSADMAALKTLYGQSPFLKIINTYPNEVVAQSDSVHYQIALDGNALKNFLINLNNLHIANVLIPQDQLSLLNDSLTTTDLQKHPIDIWISQANQLIDQVAVNVSGTSFKFTVTSFATNVTVTKPTLVKTSAEIEQQLSNLDSSNSLATSDLGKGPNGTLAQLLMIVLP